MQSWPWRVGETKGRTRAADDAGPGGADEAAEALPALAERPAVRATDPGDRRLVSRRRNDQGGRGREDGPDLPTGGARHDERCRPEVEQRLSAHRASRAVRTSSLARVRTHVGFVCTELGRKLERLEGRHRKSKGEEEGSSDV